MSDPADKSDDLIAELAKLMAASPGGDKPVVAPITRPAPLDPLATSPSTSPAPATPIRIPGMDQPRPAAVSAPSPAATAAAAPQRAPVTGAIRIPGMDNPAPVATSAPVSKFDFGARPAAAAPIKQEPLSTLTERLAAQNPSGRVEPNPGPSAGPQPAPVRIPSDLKPVSENRSFAQGPALAVATPAPQPAPAPAAPPPAASAGNGGDFGFDFGFGRNPPASASPPRPTEEAGEHDPIADLIASSMSEGGEDDEHSEEIPAPAPQAAKPATTPVTPIVRMPVTPQQAAQKPTISPIGGAPRPSTSQPIPLKPVSVAPRAPETDRFAISPGVGLNIKPQATQPLNPPAQRAPEPPKPVFNNSDPMSEIESLIGEAVRVELAPPGPVRVQAVQQRVAPHVEIEHDLDIDGDGQADTASAAPAPRPQPPQAPVVPPLNTQFAPRRAGLKDDGGQASAEDAILAAAAATGAQVDHLEPAVGDESPYRRLKVKPARSSFASGGIRQYVGMAVAGTLLLAAGLGLYWVLNMGRANTLSTGDNAPQLTADATPVKVAPSTPAATEPEVARSPVLEQMAGTSAAPSAEQLVSTDETATTPVTRDVTNVAAVEEDTEGGLANRKVRTVTVRPDGTIVSGDDAVAGAEELPVERPNVPEMPTSDTTNLLGDTTAVAMTDPTADNTALSATPEPLTTSIEPSAAPVETAEAAIAAIPNAGGTPPTPIPFPVRSETVTAFVDDAPAAPTTELTGAQTPNGQIDLLGSPIEVATAETPAAAPVSSSDAAAYVQLSSSPTEAEANSSVRALNNRFGSLFGGSKLVIQPADLGQKGTWYRVKLPVSSLASAQSVCSDIKANGGDCIVTGG
jgi:hypothetical protein